MAVAADEERPLLLHHQHHRPDQDSRYTSDGTVDINNKPALKQCTGSWRACFFLLGAELTQCVAFFAISKNLVTYLSSKLHESNVDAARNVSSWIGFSFLTPLIGAFMADTYWGRYWTIVFSITICSVGMLILSVSAYLPQLMNTSYNHSIHHGMAYLGLYLSALGSGGTKSCTPALGADQFDVADPVERVTKGSFFNWQYFTMSMSSLLSSTFLVWVQDQVGWGVGFVIPTTFAVSGIAVFVAGRKVYRYNNVGGSPLTRVFQVVVAAVSNYNVVLPEDSSALHEVPAGSTEPTCKIEHTSQFRFFDKAAVVAAKTCRKVPGGAPAPPASPWKLCTVSQVEEFKMLLRMFPIWASMVVFFVITAQMTSTFIEQGMAMDTHIGTFSLAPASLSTFEVISVMICIPAYETLLVPLARSVTGKDRGLSQLQRLGVGLALSVVAMAYTALVEARRLALAPATMSIMWQAPSYAVLGLAEVFTSIGILEFSYDQSPSGMKSLGTALGSVTIAVANYVNSAAISVVAAVTGHGGGTPGWIPDDLNEGHLDYFFWMMAALGTVNLLHFLHCSMVRTKQTARKSTGGFVPMRLTRRTTEGALQGSLKRARIEESHDLEVRIVVTEDLEVSEPNKEVPNESQDKPQEGEPEEDPEEDPEEEPEEDPEEIEQEDEPQEEQAQDEPQEEHIPPVTIIRSAGMYRSSGLEGGKTSKTLKEMLDRTDITTPPEYYIKKVIRLGRDEWRATVHLLDGEHVISSHQSPAWRATREEAVADATWEALTSLCYVFRHQLEGTSYALFPRRKSGTTDYTYAPVEGQESFSAIVRIQDVVKDLTSRVRSLQEENDLLRSQLLDTERVLRARIEMQEEQASDRQSEDTRTWTATSARKEPAPRPCTWKIPSPTQPPSEAGSRA